MEQGKTIVKARGRGGKENFPSVISGAKAEDISRCMGNCMMFYDRPIVKSDEECRERLYEFFDTCQKTGQLPTVEKMVSIRDYQADGLELGKWDWVQLCAHGPH